MVKGRGPSQMLRLRLKRLIYFNRIVRLLDLAKHWDLVIAYNYITSLAIAVYDAQ